MRMFILVCGLFLSQNIFAQASFAEVLVYDDTVYDHSKFISYKDYPLLTWSDFQGKVKTEQGFEAQTVYAMSYSLSTSSGKGKKQVKLKIACYFNKEKSWNLGPNYTDDLLEHERLHFMIAVWYFAQFKQELLTRNFPNTSVTQDIRNLYNKYSADCKKMQSVYDEETNHSIQKDQQLLWETRVKAELEKLKDYL
ncbi:MAG: hypothetical protein JNJ58_02590 [Chitinophagaceae bacterium]|nr:hypothetical protein [Chitinophagaceae bacterium]